MSIASTVFLFLFLPTSIVGYYLIPCKKNLMLRNMFLLLISIFFYTWGEPIFIFLFLFLIVFTWLFGRMAEKGRNKAIGKMAVFLTICLNVAVVLLFNKISLILSYMGLILGNNLSLLTTTLPIGFSFFGFYSISYVVDIYRGQCKSSKNILYTALYLSAFFKILQGPIISYHEFEPQLEARSLEKDNISKGIWRLSIGLGKKMIIAGNLAGLATAIFSSDFNTLSFADAWLGCIVYMVFMYFDFSGYSDMAIGLGQIFGFKVPENFNYPYISTSVAEYWRRWHITLCAWFRDYLYFPILLGPSIRFRKFLIRHNVNEQFAKTMQNIFVPSCVWIVTALWHGTNWNFTVWGLANSAAIIIEAKIKPLKNKKINTAVRWLGVMIFLALMKPFAYTTSLSNAGLYLKAMFLGNGIYVFSDLVRYYLRTSAPFFLIGIVGCFPIMPYIKKKLYSFNNPIFRKAWDIGAAVVLMVIVVLSIGYLFKTGTVGFLYQQ